MKIILKNFIKIIIVIAAFIIGISMSGAVGLGFAYILKKSLISGFVTGVIFGIVITLLDKIEKQAFQAVGLFLMTLVSLLLIVNQQYIIGISILFLCTLISSLIVIENKYMPKPEKKINKDIEGFRGIKWGTDLRTLPNMKCVDDSNREKHNFNDYDSDYIREKDQLTIGEISFDTILYRFTNNKFYGVKLYSKDIEQEKELADFLIYRFGPADIKYTDAVVKDYHWKSKDNHHYSNINLSIYELSDWGDNTFWTEKAKKKIKYVLKLEIYQSGYQYEYRLEDPQSFEEKDLSKAFNFSNFERIKEDFIYHALENNLLKDYIGIGYIMNSDAKIKILNIDASNDPHKEIEKIIYMPNLYDIHIKIVPNVLKEIEKDSLYADDFTYSYRGKLIKDLILETEPLRKKQITELGEQDKQKIALFNMLILRYLYIGNIENPVEIALKRFRLAALDL